MAEQWGGKRTPANPKPVSGPGRMSQRTDGGPQQVQAEMSGMPYGENAEFNTLQSSAPMSATPAMRPSRGGKTSAPARSGSPMVSLFSPTQRPDEPVTAGAPFGPGEGPNYSNGVRPTNSLAETLEKLLPYDTNGDIANLYIMSKNRGW